MEGENQQMSRILVVGAGVVGRATGKSLLTKGHKVIFIDKDIAVVKDLVEAGYEAYIPDSLAPLQADISMVCVNTPPRNDGSVNLDYLIAAITTIGTWLRHSPANKRHLVVIRSTVPPGTTRKIVLPLLEEYSACFSLCTMPEFLRAKSHEEDALNPWSIVMGELDRRSGDALEDICRDFGAPIYRVDLDTAEFIKYTSNVYNAAKISFSNELWLLGRELGIDANRAIEIVSTTAEGFWNPLYGTVGGQPYGGTCLPKDTKAFLKFATARSIQMPMLSSILAVNDRMEELARNGIIPKPVIEGPRWSPSPKTREDEMESKV